MPDQRCDAVRHLAPECWADTNRILVRKALAEFAHELLVEPEPCGDGTYTVCGDDGAVTYRFRADLLALDHWRIDPDSLTRTGPDGELPLDAQALVLELRDRLGLSVEMLPACLEEVGATAAALAYRTASPAPSAADLAGAGFQDVERAMTEGHPCFVANAARLGFDAAEYLAYAPEAGTDLRLVWVAARRDRCTLAVSAGLDHAAFLAAELGEPTLARFAGTLERLGLDQADYCLVPVHPWQWWNKVATTLAPDLARRDLVCLGYGDDAYRPQQSVRTLFNLTAPERHYVKTALSVLNMGFLRGMSAAYLDTTPAVNDWVAGLVAADGVLRRARFGVLREVAAVAYRSEMYEAATAKGSPYRKLLAALWRESAVPALGDGERLVTMAALLHVDRAGRSFAGALVARSGLPPARWLRAYLDAYLVPVLHCLYAYGLAFMPHGENVLLVLEGDVPRRVLVKDIGEEVVVMDPSRPLPAGIERIRVDMPDELWPLAVFTDVFDGVFRFLAAALDGEGVLAQDAFWATVAGCIRDYQASVPHLAERFARYDLFAEAFPRSCLNRLQLRDNRQMVDLTDPAGSMLLAGTLPNPIAPYASRPVPAATTGPPPPTPMIMKHPPCHGTEDPS